MFYPLSAGLTSHNGLYVNPFQEPYLFQLGQHRGHYAKCQRSYYKRMQGITQYAPTELCARCTRVLGNVGIPHTPLVSLETCYPSDKPRDTLRVNQGLGFREYAVLFVQHRQYGQGHEGTHSAPFRATLPKLGDRLGLKL